jgi:hypothetical protein
MSGNSIHVGNGSADSLASWAPGVIGCADAGGLNPFSFLVISVACGWRIPSEDDFGPFIQIRFSGYKNMNENS